MSNAITVKAPSSTANLGPGFDIFGLALDAFYDKVTISKRKEKGIKIITSNEIPTDPNKNTAGLVAKAMKKKFKIKDGLEIKIIKKVPVGFGLGSSAASAAATAVALSNLFKLKLSPNKLVEFAGIGEKASAGTIHYDNVAASVLGGFVMVRTKPLDVMQIDPPKDLVLCVAIPKLKVPEKKTEVSRSVIPKRIEHVLRIKSQQDAAAIIFGFFKKDSIRIGLSIIDEIVEPARQHMIPGFKHVKRNALEAGALGVTISGAGPSVIAFATSSSALNKICSAMERGFSKAKTDCDTIICKPSKGARVIKK